MVAETRARLAAVSTPSTAPTDLLGEWLFTRRIDDRAAGRRGTVAGRMRLVLEVDGRVRWDEEGALSWPGAEPLPVTRTLYAAPRDDGWMVTFSDGRDFHPWRPGEVVEHPCGPDLYRGLVHGPASGTRGWSVMWECTGPAKDYSMTTLLRPAAQGHVSG